MSPDSLATAEGIVEAAIGFGILIFVHELGHFLAAKWIGVRVDAFSLGFGPSLKKKWGETEYRLGICPIGGYVKMAGEEPSPDKPPQPGEFYSKSVG
ncbi:MAG: site-2 protease family protein, partial [Candidatus Brocadiia bacterium]